MWKMLLLSPFSNQNIRHLVCFGVCLILSISLVDSVDAAGETMVSISPEYSEIFLNGDNQTAVSVTITDAVDINAFDIIITYDEEVAILTDWSHGGFLRNLICLITTNNPGYFRLVCAQNASPGVSGDGVLLNLTFAGVSKGQTQVSLEKAELSNKDNELILPTVQDGWLTTTYDPSLLDHFPLTGDVSLQGQAQRAGVTMALGLGEIYQIGPYGTISLDQVGENLFFGDVVGDTYTITTSQPRYLNLTVDLAKTITLSAEKTSINPLWLVAGNAVWTDNVIDAADASLVGASFGMTEADLLPGEMLDADLNFDGVVNLRDLALVAGNYDLTASQAYQDWTP
jgi:hypothetical protein